MKNFLTQFILILILTVCGTPLFFGDVLAQDAGNGNIVDLGGNKGVNAAASGTVIAAAMESVGYQAQAQVLSQMKETLQELSGLIYIGVILSVIITAGLMGNYTPVLWLLMGPPIFIYASGVDIAGKSNQLNTTGPDWKFGAFEDTANFKQQTMLRADNAVDVSFIFHKYNELISEIYQEIIKKITSEDTTNQILFMSRQRVLEDLFAIQMTDPKSIELSAFFMSSCSNEMTLAREIAATFSGGNSSGNTDYQVLQEQYCRLYAQPDKQIRSVGLEQYLTTLTPAHTIGEPVNCATLWVWLRQSLNKDLASQTEASLNAAIPAEARITALGYSGAAKKIVDDLLKKITTKNSSKGSVKDPCPQGSGGADDEGIVSQGDSYTFLANIMSQYMLKKLQAQGKASTAYQKILAGDNSGVNDIEDTTAGGQRSNLAGASQQLRRMKSQELSVAKKYETFVFLNAIPYFQGAMLYALALLYPFFAMMLIVPGKASAFLSWMALWAWVKSWDIGWAIVMVTDKLLWNIMPHSTFYDLSADTNFTPVKTAELNFSGDYAYSISLYWTIISMLVTSVPIISAEIILGAKRSIAGAITSGASDMAARYSASAEGYTATRNIGAVADQRSAAEMKGTSSSVSNAGQVGAQIENAANKEMGAPGQNQGALMSGSPTESPDKRAKETIQSKKAFAGGDENSEK